MVRAWEMGSQTLELKGEMCSLASACTGEAGRLYMARGGWHDEGDPQSSTEASSLHSDRCILAGLKPPAHSLHAIRNNGVHPGKSGHDPEEILIENVKQASMEEGLETHQSPEVVGLPALSLNGLEALTCWRGLNSWKADGTAHFISLDPGLETLHACWVTT